MGKVDIGAVVTDLDGTLLNDNKQIGAADYDALSKLGEIGVIRVAATGRNLRISQEVLSPDFPIDYLVFSTGCGIYDWKNKKIVESDGLPWHITQKVIERFKHEAFDFTIHQPIPDNYQFYYHKQNEDNYHFNDYVERYSHFGEPLTANHEIENACQMLAIIETDTDKYDELTKL